MTNIQEIIIAIQKYNQQEIDTYGDGFLLEPITKLQLENVQMSSINLLSSRLSNDYLECLKISDGFSINGLNLYSSIERETPYYLPDIITSNLAFWNEKELKKYIAYGDENSSRLVFDIEKNKFMSVDYVTWEPIKEFNEFYQLLSFVLTEANILDIN